MPQLDPLEIIAKVQGEQEIEKLEAGIERASEAIGRLTKKFEEGAISEAEFTKSAKIHAEAIAAATARIDELKAKFPEFGNSAGKAANDLTRLSYSINRLEHGTRGILHAIPQLLELIGLGGLAGVAALAAESVHLFEENWDAFMIAMGNERNLDSVKSWQERLGSLVESVEKLGVAMPKSVKEFVAGLAVMHQKLLEYQREGRQEEHYEQAGVGVEFESSPEQERIGKIFRTAVKKFGAGGRTGGQRLTDQLVEEQKKRVKAKTGEEVTPNQEVEIRRWAAIEIGKGLSGRVPIREMTETYGVDFSRMFRKTLEEEGFQKDEDKLRKIAQKQEEMKIKDKQREDKEYMDDFERRKKDLHEKQKAEHYFAKLLKKEAKDEFEREKREKTESLQDQIRKLHRYSSDLRDSARLEGRSETMDARQYATKVLQGGFESIPKQQLEAQIQIRKAIERLEDKLLGVSRMRFKY